MATERQKVVEPLEERLRILSDILDGYGSTSGYPRGNFLADMRKQAMKLLAEIELLDE